MEQSSKHSPPAEIRRAGGRVTIRIAEGLHGVNQSPGDSYGTKIRAVRFRNMVVPGYSGSGHPRFDESWLQGVGVVHLIVLFSAR